MYQPLSLFFWAYRACRSNNLFTDYLPPLIKNNVKLYDEMVVEYNKKQLLKDAKDTLFMWNWRYQSLLPKHCYEYLMNIDSIPEFVDEHMYIVCRYYIRNRRNLEHEGGNNVLQICEDCFRDDEYVTEYIYLKLKQIMKLPAIYISGSVISQSHYYCDNCKYTPLFEMWPVEIYNLPYSLSKYEYEIADIEDEEDDRIYYYSQYVTHPKLL